MAASQGLQTLEVSNALQPLTVAQVKELMFQVGVPLNLLDDIDAEYKGQSRKHHYIQKWLDIDANTSWDKLVKGLRQMKMNSLAADIESTHLSMDRVVTCKSSVSPVHTAAVILSHTDNDALKLQPAGPSSTPYPTVVSQVSTTKSSKDLASLSISTHNPLQGIDSLVKEVKEKIEYLEKEFSDIKSEARQLLTEKERQDPFFLERFRDHLLDMSVTRKRVHIRFFSRNEDEIISAKTIQKLFIILGRYCNYSNYEIVFEVSKRFCSELQARMLLYHQSLTSFEKSTTVKVYLSAIAANPQGVIFKEFMHMTLKVDKQPSECTLHEIRLLKESIDERGALESYAMYIDTPGEGSVHVRLLILKEVWRKVAFVLTPDFKRHHHITNVAIREPWRRREIDLTTYLVRTIPLSTFLSIFLSTL